MPKLRLMIFATVGILLTLPGHAVAQSEGGLREQDLLRIPRSRQHDSNQLDRNTSSTSRASEEFLNSLAQDQLLEVAAAQLAVRKSANPQITQYAQQLISDHTQYSPQLLQLAEQKGTAFPTDLDRDSRTTLDQLSQLQGTAFDRAYVQQTIETNNHIINNLQQTAETIDDSAIQTFISQFLPIQQQHLQQAATLESNGNGGNGNDSNYR